MKTVEIFVLSTALFVVATLAAEWATRKAWPADFPSQKGG